MPTHPPSEQIPKTLHQTFRTRDLRPELASNVAAMRKANPDWDYRFYDDADIRAYILKYYGPGFLAYFDALNPGYAAARADLFRYLLMYREGGVYLDIKSQACRPLSEVIRPDDRYLISQWRNGPNDGYSTWGLHSELRNVDGGEFQQWFIVAAPGHPFLRATIDSVLHKIRRYNPLLHSVGKRAVLRTTGPIAYTLAIAPIRRLHPHRQVDSCGDLGFRYSIYANDDHQTALGEPHYSNLEAALVGADRVTAAAAAMRLSFDNLYNSLSGRLRAQAA